MPRCILSFLLLLFLSIAAVQTTMIDSLKRNIATAPGEAGRLTAVMAFCNQWDCFNMDTLHKYALMADSLATRQKNNTAGLYAQYYLVAWLLQEDKLDTALNKINGLISDIKKSLPYGDLYLRVYRLKGNILSRGMHPNELAANSFELLKLAEANSDTVGMISATTSIGNANTRLEKYTEAIRWHKQALELMHNPVYKRKMSLVYSNIAIVYDNMEKNDSAEYYLKQAIQYAKENNNLTDESNAWAVYGNVISKSGKIKEAEHALKTSVALQQQIGDSYYTVSGMDLLGKFYALNKDYEKGIAEFLAALDMSNKNRAPFAQNIILYEDLASAYKEAGNYQKANEFLSQEMAAMDSTYQANSALALAEMQAKYETQKKETTILQQKYELNKERSFRYALLGLALVLACILLMAARYRKNRQQLQLKKIELENERRTLLAVEGAKEEERGRIIADLHDDVGGGLSTVRMVSDLIAAQPDAGSALQQYALKISGITKEVTQRMNTIVWALTAENDNLQNLWEYIRGYGFRFFEDTPIAFQFDLPASPSDTVLSGLRRKNIFLCVKEGLNNVYKHSGAKKAWIVVSLADNKLTLSVNDNGKGIQNENIFGNGLRNMRKRMEEIHGSVTFSGGDFTSVVLSVPIV